MTALVASWLLVLLTVLAVSFGHQVVGHAHATLGTGDADELASLARSGVAFGQRYLDRWVRSEPESALGASTSEEIGPVDLAWTNDPRLRVVPVGSGFVSIGYAIEEQNGPRTRYGFEDENRRVPLTLIDRPAARRIPGLSPEAVDAIGAWRADADAHRNVDLDTWPGIDARSRAILDRLVTPFARNVNVNTASVEVLELLGVPLEGARKLVAHRNGPDTLPGTADDRLFTRLDDPEGGLRGVGLSADESAAVAFLVGRGHLTVTSDVFRVRSRGWTDEMGPWCEITAVLDCSSGEWEVRSWTQRRSG